MAQSKMERGRFSSRKKVEAVLRGEDLDLVSRQTGITAADGRDEELARLKALVGDLTMRLELSREAVSRLRAGAPSAAGRSTR